MQEQSYVDLLTALREAVDTDMIPDGEKRNIFYHIDELQEILWKYSA